MKQISAKIIAVILFFTFINVNYCLSQNARTKMKMKIDSLYPKATIIGWWGGPIPKTQEVEIECNCSEFGGYMQLTLDTNANILTKVYYFWSVKDLPETMLTYMKKNTSESVKFDTGYYEKSINYEGKIFYCIRMYENGAWYEIKFNSSGELISKTKEIQYRG